MTKKGSGVLMTKNKNHEWLAQPIVLESDGSDFVLMKKNY